MSVPVIAWYVVGGVLVAGIISMIPVMKVVNKIAPYSYPNARIRAMKVRMVKDEEFINLSKRPYNDVLAALEQKAYPNLTQGLGADLSYAKIDTSLRKHLVGELEKIKRISPPDSKPYIEALLSKYDIQVIESIVRSGKIPGSKTSELLHDTALFSKAFITQDNHTVDQLINELKGSPYEKIIRKHQDAIKQGKYSGFEQELDLLYFARLKGRAKSLPAKRYTKAVIDAHNISLALKGMTPIIKGGKIHRETIKTKDLTKLQTALKEAGYNAEGKTPELLEKAIQQDMKKFAQALMANDPLSDNSIVGYVALKRTNVRNTAILLKMKYHGFTPEKIQEVLAL